MPGTLLIEKDQVQEQVVVAVGVEVMGKVI
jgi:hypothetical protein